MDKDIKLRIKEIRKDINATQEQFASFLGVTRQTISHIERGINTPSDQLIKLICKEFGIREEWLRTGQGEMKRSPEDIIKEATSKLSPEEAREAINNLINELDNGGDILSFEEEKDKPEFFKVLDFLKNKYEEADQDMKGWLTVEIKKNFPEYEQYVKKNQPEQKNA